VFIIIKQRIDTVKVETDVSIDNEEYIIGMETDEFCAPQECEPEEKIDTVTVGVENVGEEDCIKIKTEEHFIQQLVRVIKAEQENCMGFVKGDTGSCSETCVTCDGDGTEEFSIKVEDAIDIKEEVSFKVEGAIDIKDEIPEAVSFPPFETEHEIHLSKVFNCVRLLSGTLLHLLKILQLLAVRFPEL